MPATIGKVKDKLDNNSKENKSNPFKKKKMFTKNLMGAR